MGTRLPKLCAPAVPERSDCPTERCIRRFIDSSGPAYFQAAGPMQQAVVDASTN